MVNAQEWLDKKYFVKLEKKLVKELEISDENLEGNLNLRSVVNLKKLICQNSQLTSLDAKGCSKLTKLYFFNSKIEKLYLDGVNNTDWEKVQEELEGCLKKDKKGRQYYDLQELRMLQYNSTEARPLLGGRTPSLISTSTFASSSHDTANYASEIPFSPISPPSSIIESSEVSELKKEIKKINNKNEELRKKSQELSQQLMECKYRELLQIRKELKEDEETDKLSKKEVRELTGREEFLKSELGKLQNDNIRTILIIGEINKGKSTLASVLSASEHFHENHGGNRSKEIRDKEFDVDWIRYRVVDTGGIGEEEINKLKTIPSKESALEKLTEFVKLSGEGLNQILLVVDAGPIMNEKWIEFYNLLGSVIFDDNTNKYVTVVRTKFPDFDKEKECQRERQEILNKIMNYLSISSSKIIFVDNEPNNEERREASRKVLLNHLSSCRDTYLPKNLEKLNEILKIEFDEEKVKEEMEVYYQQEDKKNKINNQLVKTSELLGGGINMVSSVVNFITIVAGIASCRIM